MTSRKYRVRSTDELHGDLKKKAAAFSRTLRGLEDRAKKCESLKWMDRQSSGTILPQGDMEKYFLDWQPYLNDGKRKLSRTLTKLKEIRNHRKQRKTSFIGSVKEALPSWAKKKVRGSYIQLDQLINDTEDYEALIADIVQQIKSADDLSNIVNKISRQQDSKENDQFSKDFHDLSNRWNLLNLDVINKSNSLESLGLEVDLEYRKLNEWFEKCNAFRPWLDSTEKILKEESGTDDNIPAVKEKLKSIQEKMKECQSRKTQLQQINGDADVLQDSGRLDQGDAERVGRINEILSTRQTTINEKLVETEAKLYGSIHLLKKKPGEKIETHIEEDSVKPNHMPPRKIISPFHKDEDNTNEHKINDSMKSIKKMLGKADNRYGTEREKERIRDESAKAFEASLDTCEKAINELDEESLHNFSAVGSTVKEVDEQLDEIQVLEPNMEQENKNFILVKETFDESEDKNVVSEESRRRLRRKVDDLNIRWEEMWRSHGVNKDRLVQAILIMGGQWMERVNISLDELEDSMNSVEIQEDNLEALREEEQRHKEVMNKINSHEDSVSGAVDVAREVHRRDLVTEETGETIERETQALEDRLERLINEAEDRKRRIAVALRNAEQANTVNETMVATSVISVHSAPDDLQTDEGFVEPKQHFFKKKKVTYESLINEKMNEFKKESKTMNDWMDETERLVKSLSVDNDPKKATKIQVKINARYEEVQEKQTKVDLIVQLSKQIENETLDPTISEPLIKQADALKERWTKDKEMIEKYGEKDVESKAEQSNCCLAFLKKRLYPAWSYN